MSMDRLDQVAQTVAYHANQITEAARVLCVAMERMSQPDGDAETLADEFYERVQQLQRDIWQHFEEGKHYFDELNTLSQEYENELTRLRIDHGLPLPPRTPGGQQLSTAIRAIAVLWFEVEQVTELYRNDPTLVRMKRIADLRSDFSGMITSLKQELAVTPHDDLTGGQVGLEERRATFEQAFVAGFKKNNGREYAERQDKRAMIEAYTKANPGDTKIAALLTAGKHQAASKLFRNAKSRVKSQQP